MPSPVVYSSGISVITDILEKQADASRIFLVTGRSSFQTTGAKSAISKLLKPFHVHRYCDFSTNPRLEEVLQGAEQYEAFMPDVIIAIGGGSVLDMAKLIAVLPHNKDKARDMVLKGSAIPRRQAGFIAIPTTSGSGSEHTQFAVVYMENKKHSLESGTLLPDHIILDASLTFSMSQYLTASTGVDALAQAIESFWAVKANKISREFAAKAIKTILEVFPDVVNNPNPYCRRKMMEGAHLAGKAINISKTTAPHALSYELTSKYGISHGHAVALTLPQFFQYNLSQNEEQKLRVKPQTHKYMVKELCRLLKCENPKEGKEKLEKILAQSSLKMKLTEQGAKNLSDIPQMVNGVNADRLSNNPVAVSKETIQNFYQNIW